MTDFSDLFLDSSAGILLDSEEYLHQTYLIKSNQNKKIAMEFYLLMIYVRTIVGKSLLLKVRNCRAGRDDHHYFKIVVKMDIPKMLW